MSVLKYYIPIFSIMFILFIISIYYNKKKIKPSIELYKKKYPGAVKVLLKSTNFVVASSSVEIYKIDEEPATTFMEGLNFYTWIKPGKSIIQLRYNASRIGFFYKSVNTYVDWTPVEVNLESGKEYVISFDKKVGFKISQINKN